MAPITLRVRKHLILIPLAILSFEALGVGQPSKQDRIPGGKTPTSDARCRGVPTRIRDFL